MTITLTQRETARLIVDRANELQELVNQKCEPKHRDIWRAALRTLENRIWEAACHSIYALTTELSHLASTHEEGRSIPEDANKAVGILGELIENVKTLYRITAGDSSQQTE